MTGTSLSATSRLSSRQSANPSSPGIRMSLTTTSGQHLRMTSRAKAPSWASITSAPAARSKPLRNHTTAGSSSATTMDRPERLTASAERLSLVPVVRGRSSLIHGASGTAPSGPLASNRTIPPERSVTSSRMRATADHTAARISVPWPSGTVAPRA